MFDPTAFENMKVVLEGALYDHDLAGEIFIADRNDYINMAKLERRYEIAMTDQRDQDKVQNLSLSLVLDAKLKNLAAELLPSLESIQNAGCSLTIHIYLSQKNEHEEFIKVDQVLKSIWGEDRQILQSIHYNPLAPSTMIHNHIVIMFDRLISEDQMDDLIEMVDYLLETLKKLRSLITT
ncbi:hypothetical protein [Bacillus sp. 03113]|uniref:hypothetical protein n=1 Tax=Bacillus sp. 03113 TaxID=2578211 RepID=UPI001142CD81|nr:hypothetical protein [Bacillus sp. 03113]